MATATIRAPRTMPTRPTATGTTRAITPTGLLTATTRATTGAGIGSPASTSTSVSPHGTGADRRPTSRKDMQDGRPIRGERASFVLDVLEPKGLGLAAARGEAT